MMKSCGDLRTDLEHWIASAVQILDDLIARQVVRALAGAASEDENEAGRLYEHITGPAYRVLMGTVLFRLIAGLPPASGVSTIVDTLLGDNRLDGSESK